MSIELNAFGKGLEYNKEEYLNKFIPLVIENAPKYEIFSVLEMHKTLELNENDIIIFKNLVSDIRVYLIDNGYAEFNGSSNIKMTEKGINYFDDGIKKELENKILKLTETNLILQNSHIKKYIRYSIISFILGGVLSNLKDILCLLSTIRLE